MRNRFLFLLVAGGAFLGATGAAHAACNGLTATITGTNAGEVINGTAGADVIEALGGADTINGAGGSDTICAGDGYDTVVGGSGNDWMDAGLAGGVLDFSAAPASVTVNLTTGSATGDGTDTITGFGDVYGSTAYGDVITGNGNSNYIVGWGGADFLIGLGSGDYLQGLDGDDTIEGGAGNDTYDAGNGLDTADFTNAGGAVTVSLATVASQNTVSDGSDTITATENLKGSGHADTLTGSTAANVINGQGGNDTISGGDGADTLTGGAGVDILHGQNDNDALSLYDSASDSATASTCGGGTDTITLDVGDTIGGDCETTTYPADVTAPTASLGSISAVTGSTYQYATGSTVFVNTTQTGSFSVNVTATDAGSGMKQVEYPALGTGWSPSAGNDTGTPFNYVYTWSVAAASPGAKTAIARDNANNGANVAFTVTADASLPTGGSATYLNGYTNATSINVAVLPGSDALSGIASWQLQRRSATLTGTTCGSYGSWSNIGSASPASPYADATIANNTCYQYQLNTTDRVGNVGTFTSGSTLKVERTAPTGLAVANLTGNTRVDGVAVLTWTAATDTQSGINRYEVKSWPDGAAEPADSEFRSTSSTVAGANIRIGVNPTTSPWDWKFKVRAVDGAGNTTASSSEFRLTGSTNQVQGTTGDQSTTDIGSGSDMQVGHSTGNLTISNTDVSTKAYGVELAVSRTYNHQNIQFQPVIGDTGWNTAVLPSDTHSYTAQWAFGFHAMASFEQRLVSGDDGTDDGAANTLSFIDATGNPWPFTATASGATTYASPVGMEDWALVGNPSSGTYPTCETGGVNSDYALRDKGGETKCFDTKGRLLRETMANGRSITYTRNGDGRVTGIAADDPDGGGALSALALTLSYNGDKRVSKISDQLGRETRYDYVNYSGMYYLNKIEKYSDSGSATALTRTDYGWDSNSSRRINSVDEWVYADDPGTGTSNDPLKHHWDITYNGANRVATVTEAGTISRAVGSGSETIPAVAATITTMDYVTLTSGGSSATMTLDVKRGAAADDDAFGVWNYTLDTFGRALIAKNPVEAGASVPSEVDATYTSSGRIATSTDVRGDVTSYTYDASGNATQTKVDHIVSTVPDTISQGSDFTSLGQPQTTTALRSPDGSFLGKWPYTLNECVDAGVSGTFKVTTAGTSASVAPTWPGSGTVASGTVTFTKVGCTATPQGVATTHVYDSNGNELQAKDPLGVRTCSYYTAFGEIDVQYKLDGADCPGSPNTAARVKGTLMDHTYDGRGFLTQTTTDESTTKYTHDDAGQRTEERLVVDAGDSTKDVVTVTTFDGVGRASAVKTTDAASVDHTTSTSFTMLGDAKSTTVPNSGNPTGLSGGSPAGDVTATRFDARGLAYLVTNPDATIITKRHDGRARPVFVSVPHAASNSTPMATAISYFYSGAKKTKEDPAGIITTYDPSVTVPGADERPLKVDSPVAGVTTFTYNASGATATKVTSAGTFTYGYDGNGNLAKTVYPSGDVLVQVRDTRGNVLERRFTPNGGSTEVTASAYRADDKLLTEDQPSGGIDTTIAYSGSTGQLTQTDLDDGAGWTQQNRFSYDFAGRLATQTLENGASDFDTTYVYEDKSGRMKRIEQPNGIDERYAYDEQGRVTELKAVKRSDSTWQGGDTYAYDTQGRITTRIRRESGTSYATAYTYDPAGQVTSETSPNGIVRGYVYRNANDQDAFGTDLNRQILYVNSAPAGALSLSRVNEIEACLTTTTSCGAADEAAIDTAIADIASPGTTLDPALLTSTAADVARWLKLRNNRQDWAASTAFAVGTCIAPNGWQWERYKVTAAGTSSSTQPTWPASGTVADGSVTWTKTNCTPVLVYRQYVYDSGSPSKHQMVRQDDSYGSPTYLHYDGLGRLDYRGATPYAGTPNQAWDAQGRPTVIRDVSGGVVAIAWSSDSWQLASWTAGGVTYVPSYGSDGRIRRVVASGSLSFTTEFAYEGDTISAFKTGGAWYWLESSQRGDLVGIRDSSGLNVASLRYSAYGDSWSSNAGLTSRLPVGFGGWHGSMVLAPGLIHMGHRVYASDRASFISGDPVAAGQGELQGPYNYADGDPVNLSDPSGRDSCSWYAPTLTFGANRMAYWSAGISCSVRNTNRYSDIVVLNQSKTTCYIPNGPSSNCATVYASPRWQILWSYRSGSSFKYTCNNIYRVFIERWYQDPRNVGKIIEHRATVLDRKGPC